MRQQTFAKASPLVWRASGGYRDGRTTWWLVLQGHGGEELSNVGFMVKRGGGGSNRGCENTVFYFAERFTVTGAGAATTRIISSFKYRARPRLTFPRRQLNKFKTPVARSTLFDHLDREQGREGLWQYIIYIYTYMYIVVIIARTST